jgi:hypothetical protein
LPSIRLSLIEDQEVGWEMLTSHGTPNWSIATENIGVIAAQAHGDRTA